MHYINIYICMYIHIYIYKYVIVHRNVHNIFFLVTNHPGCLSSCWTHFTDSLDGLTATGKTSLYFHVCTTTTLKAPSVMYII